MQNNWNMQGCGGFNYMQPQPKNEYAFVDGIEGARAYSQVRPNSMMLLMDSQQPICYKKQVDMYGRTVSLEVYDLVLHVDKPNIEYVSKETFDKEISDLKALFKGSE